MVMALIQEPSHIMKHVETALQQVCDQYLGHLHCYSIEGTLGITVDNSRAVIVSVHTSSEKKNNNLLDGRSIGSGKSADTRVGDDYMFGRWKLSKDGLHPTTSKPVLANLNKDSEHLPAKMPALVTVDDARNGQLAASKVVASGSDTSGSSNAAVNAGEESISPPHRAGIGSSISPSSFSFRSELGFNMDFRKQSTRDSLQHPQSPASSSGQHQHHSDRIVPEKEKYPSLVDGRDDIPLATLLAAEVLGELKNKVVEKHMADLNDNFVMDLSTTKRKSEEDATVKSAENHVTRDINSNIPSTSVKKEEPEQPLSKRQRQDSEKTGEESRLEDCDDHHDEDEEGDTTGKYKDVNGEDVYVVMPTSPTSEEKSMPKKGSLHIDDETDSSSFSCEPRIEVDPVTGKSKKIYECPKCFKVMGSGWKLRRHIRAHLGQKPFKCNTCGKEFVESALLKRHLRTHSGEKPFRCDICCMVFTDSGNLRKHVRIHGNNNPHECYMCGQGFLNVDDLYSHMGQHTGKRPFNCQECKRSFTQVGHLTIHKLHFKH